MRQYYFITIILIILTTPFFACDNNAAKKLHESNKVKAPLGIEVSSDKQVQGEILHGIALITDEQFKRDLLEYLAFDERLDYINIYRYLSKEYLKKYFPNIKNAEEYKKDMENSSERSALKYLEITKWTKLKKNHYEVKLILEENSEGEMMKVKALYFFVNENGKWKYDSEKLISYLYYERGDKTWKDY